MLLSGDQRSQGARPCPFYRSGAASQAASASSPASQPLASAARTAARPLRAHAETGLLSLPGALCVKTVTTGSQPEPSVLVVHSCPDLVVAAACKSSGFSEASTTIESKRWLKVKRVSISSESATIPYQQRLATHGPLFKLATGRGAGEELNNENNCNN